MDSGEIKITSNWSESEIRNFFGELLDNKFTEPVEFFVDKLPVDKKESVKRFVLLLEPPEIAAILCGSINSDVITFQDRFDYVLTHNQDVLDKLPGKAILFPYGTMWIKDYRFPEKEFSVSTLVGSKVMTYGHELRQKLWFKENRIKNIPTKFFLSGNASALENYNNNLILRENKDELFDSQFHVCIENAKRDNWFTEKLIDCLQTKTVPIYWGCPNIGNWFNTKGFIMVDNLEDIIDACNSLNDGSYKEKLEFIEENFEKSKNFININHRIKEEINHLLTL